MLNWRGGFLHQHVFPRLAGEGLEILSEVHPALLLRLLLLLLVPQLLNRQLQTSVGTAGPQPPAPPQWALLDCNCERQIAVDTGHCRTSTARARCQGALWDLNCECRMSHRMSDRMSAKMPECLIECHDGDHSNAFFNQPGHQSFGKIYPETCFKTISTKRGE